MSPRKALEQHGRKITATGLVASLAGVITLLTMVADLNGKLATSQSNADGWQQLAAQDHQDLQDLKKFTGFRKHGKAVPVPSPSEGLARRLFHMLF